MSSGNANGIPEGKQFKMKTINNLLLLAVVAKNNKFKQWITRVYYCVNNKDK